METDRQVTMNKFIKSFFDLLFMLILGIFFVVFILKISISKASLAKERLAGLSVNVFKKECIRFKERFMQFVGFSRNVFSGAGLPLIHHASSEISQRLFTKKK